VAGVTEPFGRLAANDLVARGVDDEDADVGLRERGAQTFEVSPAVLGVLLGPGVKGLRLARSLGAASPSQPNRPVM
jgi:hypothetical protein